MWILPLVGYAGTVIGFCFLTLAIASGLYYLSELVEEHSVIAKRFLTRLIYTVVVIQTALWIADGFPFWATMLGVFSHVIYLGNMRRFPFVKLSDPLFILSCILVLLNHYVWFRHFSHTQSRAYQRNYYDRVDAPSFTMIASYFGLCVWLVPFALFVSLSAGDNVLPTIGSEPSHGGLDGKSKPQGMIKAVVDSIRGAIGQIAGSSGGGRP
ncbi:DUF396 domain protein [Dactylonectria estremocensis]|uniref:DUF396 domain protein n=1 Tax=Dactylonectria estremocensis TaxID=1079267 RepID=A0A9P9EYT4_9HYPO|nr:DUF396 domain protein [Dactylonectria estremocensis]